MLAFTLLCALFATLPVRTEIHEQDSFSQFQESDNARRKATTEAIEAQKREALQQETARINLEEARKREAIEQESQKQKALQQAVLDREAQKREALSRDRVHFGTKIDLSKSTTPTSDTGPTQVKATSSKRLGQKVLDWLTTWGDKANIKLILKNKSENPEDLSQDEELARRLKKLSTKEKQEVFNEYLNVQEKNLRKSIQEIRNNPSSSIDNPTADADKAIAARIKNFKKEIETITEELQRSLKPTDVIVTFTDAKKWNTHFDIIDMEKFNPQNDLTKQYQDHVKSDPVKISEDSFAQAIAKYYINDFGIELSADSKAKDIIASNFFHFDKSLIPAIESELDLQINNLKNTVPEKDFVTEQLKTAQQTLIPEEPEAASQVVSTVASATQKLEGLVSQVDKPLSPQSLGQLITKVDDQVQKSNTEIFAPRIQELKQQYNDSLTILGLDAAATPRAIKIAYNQAALAYHPDTTIFKGSDKFIQITQAYEFLTKDYPQEISAITKALKHQEKLLLTFDQKASIARPLSNDHEQNTDSDQEQKTDLEEKSITTEERITAEELRKLDMEKRFEKQSQESAKQAQENAKVHSEKLLMNFQINAKKIKEAILEPSLANIPDIIDTGWLSTRHATRLISGTTAQQEIQSEIINPYLEAINNLYNPEIIKEMNPDDQEALKLSYEKSMNAYKDAILTYFKDYEAKNSSDPKLKARIKEISKKLDLIEKPD
jgi:curved DNA-binding protein CbpA